MECIFDPSQEYSLLSTGKIGLQFNYDMWNITASSQVPIYCSSIAVECNQCCEMSNAVYLKFKKHIVNKTLMSKALYTTP